MSSPRQRLAAVLAESGPEYTGFSFERPGGGHQSDVSLVKYREQFNNSSTNFPIPSDGGRWRPT